MKDTADVREKMLKLWKQVDENKIATPEARVHIGIARTILDTIKVEIAAAHLSQAQIPAVPLLSRAEQKTINARRQ